MTAANSSNYPAGLARPGQGPFSRWPRASDAILALVVFLLEVAGTIGMASEEVGGFDLSTLGRVSVATYVLLAASSIALLWRRKRPLGVLAATLLAALVWDVIGLADGPSLAIFIALYGIGRYIHERAASFVAVGAAMVLALSDDLVEGETAAVMGVSVGVVVLAWYIGRRVRGRREYLDLLEERTEYLERERVAEAQRAVDEERTRIARELHDVVAHRVSMMTVQAGAAQTVAASDPGRAVRAMGAVEEAGREALDELRQILGVLRADSNNEALAPVHGFADIPGLVDDMRAVGMDVSLSFDPPAEDLPARLDLASYRIVQEALTNVFKHAGREREAEVRLSSDERMLTIEVTNRTVAEASVPGSGHGLVGMRERAVLLGGTFEAGPRPGGGFAILARLPIERGPS